MTRPANRSSNPTVAAALVQGELLLEWSGDLDVLGRVGPRGGGWLCEGAINHQGPFVDLNALALAEARLARSGALSRPKRYRQEVTGRILEVRCEKLKLKGERLALVLFQEVTEHLKVVEELAIARRALQNKERLRALGEVASGVAHDVNNALNVLSLRLRLLHEQATTEGRALIDNMQRIVADCAGAVGRLQDFARKRRDRPVGSVALAELVSHACEMARTAFAQGAALRDRSLRMEIDVPVELPPVRGSEAELAHVLLNLLLNARDAMPTGGTIRLSAIETRRRVQLRIADTGTGIDKRFLTRIFDPFFTTKGHRGTGLGLSMAQSVMTRLGGSIVAENGATGGAIFTLEFPRAAPQPRERATPPISRATRRRVLVVDDDRENLDALGGLLTLKGHEVELVDSGQLAIARFEARQRYDVVLCDLGMPDPNGWRVAEAVHALAPHTRTFLVTGWAFEIAETDPRRRWLAGVLPKPVNLTALLALLAEEPSVELDAEPSRR